MFLVEEYGTSLVAKISMPPTVHQDVPNQVDMVVALKKPIGVRNIPSLSGLSKIAAESAPRLHLRKGRMS